MKLYNTLSQKIETLEPIKKNEVSLYVCGITPYDTTHLGHAFTYTAFDVLYRFLQFQNYTVNYTQNVTDIDDDLLKRAKRDNKEWKELGKWWTKKYLKDMKTLNNIKPTHYVKATETIPTIATIIKKLVHDGFAYENQGNVYFEVRKDPEYGKLSKFTRNQMLQLAKERGADTADPHKKDPLDFILWQKSLPVEPMWKSSYGKGRPGWHIECSAMIYKYLGKNIDIHGGGNDLRYPHHESEIAQSENFTGKKPFAKLWMHTGTVMYKREKMSKSLGNLIMVSDLLKQYSANAIRYLLLSHHYRKPWEYEKRELDEIKKVVQKNENILKTASGSQNLESTIMDAFSTALANDLDTPKTLSILNETIQKGKLLEAKKMWNELGFTS